VPQCQFVTLWYPVIREAKYMGRDLMTEPFKSRPIFHCA